VGIIEYRSNSCLYFPFDKSSESSLQAVNKHWLLSFSIPGLYKVKALKFLLYLKKILTYPCHVYCLYSTFYFIKMLVLHVVLCLLIPLSKQYCTDFRKDFHENFYLLNVSRQI